MPGSISAIKTFRKNLNITAALLLFTFPVQIIASLLSLYLTKAFHGSLSPFISDFFLPQFIFPILLAVIVIASSMALLRVKPQQVFPVHKLKAADVILAIFIFLAASIAVSTAAAFIEGLIDPNGSWIASYDQGMVAPQGPTEILLYILAVAVLPALCEEGMYRGIVLGSLKPLNKKIAVIVSAVLFGFMHCTIQQIPVAILIGLLLGYFCIRYNSILLPIILHFANNLISIICQVVYGTWGAEIYSLFDLFLTCFFFIGGCISLIIYIIKQKNEVRQVAVLGDHAPLNPKPVLSDSKATLATVTSVAFWINIIAMILCTILYNMVLLNMQ